MYKQTMNHEAIGRWRWMSAVAHLTHWIEPEGKKKKKKQMLCVWVSLSVRSQDRENRRPDKQMEICEGCSTHSLIRWQLFRIQNTESERRERMAHAIRSPDRDSDADWLLLTALTQRERDTNEKIGAASGTDTWLTHHRVQRIKQLEDKMRKGGGSHRTENSIKSRIKSKTRVLAILQDSFGPA